MAKELPFFKFEPSEWMFGRIQKRSPQAQSAFINLCCKYWHKLGDVSIKSAELDFGKEEIAELMKYEIVLADGDNIAIKFLDNQLEECMQYSKVQSDNGKKSAEKKKRKKESQASTTVESLLTTVEPPLSDGLTTVEPIATEEKREEEKREEENRKEKSLPQNFLERFMESEQDRLAVIKYMKSIGINYHDERFKLYIEAYDAGFSLLGQESTYPKWKQYLKYFFENGEYKKVNIPYIHQERILSR